MRVSGGELRGRPLYVPKSGLRPTTGRVREAIFSMLGEIAGADVLDLYCGTGALGIEALSRGADEAVFVDKRIGTVMRNLEQLGITEGDKWQVVKYDAVDFLERSAIFEPARRWDLVFCDPPYTLADRLGDHLEPALGQCLAPGARVVVESAERKPLDLELPVLSERTYGDTRVRVHRGRAG